MDFTQLQNEVTRLLKLEGWTEVQPPPDTGALVNEALRLWSWEGEYVTSTFSTTTVPGTAEYTLPGPPDWKIVKDVWYGTGPGAKALFRSSEDQTRVDDPQWLVAAASQPDRFFNVKTNVIRIYPTPNDAQPLLMFGIIADTDLVLPSDSPKCPAHYHRSIARLAAWCYGDGFAQGDAMQRIEIYYEKALDQARDCKLWIASQNQMGLQRTVKRRGPERLLLTGEDSSVRSL